MRAAITDPAEPELHPNAIGPVCMVICALRDGWGVDDMQANGICSAGFAREIVSLLRAHGALDRAIGQVPVQ